MSLSIGSLATGYGGLDAAVQAAFGGEVAWVADNDPDACKILEARFPGIPNLGDIREVDWEAVPPVDVVTAGFPCQDVSSAGLREGLQPGNRSGLWLNIVRAIAVLRPSIVIIENVKGLLSARAHSGVEPCPWCLGDRAADALRALGAVLGSLAGLGFDAEWSVVSAADAGSCHKRERVWILAWDNGAWQAAAELAGARCRGAKNGGADTGGQGQAAETGWWRDSRVQQPERDRGAPAATVPHPDLSARRQRRFPASG